MKTVARRMERERWFGKDEDKTKNRERKTKGSKRAAFPVSIPSLSEPWDLLPGPWNPVSCGQDPLHWQPLLWTLLLFAFSVETLRTPLSAFSLPWAWERGTCPPVSSVPLPNHSPSLLSGIPHIWIYCQQSKPHLLSSSDPQVTPSPYFLNTLDPGSW